VSLAAYAEVLAPELGHGFDVGELVKAGSRRHVMPPEHTWKRMRPVLQLANNLRERMMKRRSIVGLRVNAAYRPVGGAANSQHKLNRAIDLDLFAGDARAPGMQSAYYEEAVRLWVDACKMGMRVGLGLYCPRDYCAGIRVHLDVGYYTRTWQHGYAAGSPDAKVIAKRLGLVVP
jgi:hypothetical protein